MFSDEAKIAFADMPLQLDSRRLLVRLQPFYAWAGKLEDVVALLTLVRKTYSQQAMRKPI